MLGRKRVCTVAPARVQLGSKILMHGRVGASYPTQCAYALNFKQRAPTPYTLHVFCPWRTTHQPGLPCGVIFGSRAGLHGRWHCGHVILERSRRTHRRCSSGDATGHHKTTSTTRQKTSLLSGACPPRIRLLLYKAKYM